MRITLNFRLNAKAAMARAVFALAVLGSSLAQAADPALPPAIAEHVPADAAAIVSLRLPEVEDGFAFADLLSGLYPKLAQAVSTIRAPLALPAFSESEISDRGVVAEKPTFASLMRRPANLSRAGNGFAHRLVVPIHDRAKFITYAQSVLGRLRFATTTPCRKCLSWAKPLAAVAKKQAIELWGFNPSTAQGVSVRFVEKELDLFALIDAFVPELAKPPGKKSTSIFSAGMKATLAQTDIATLASVWNEGTRTALGAKASIVLVLQPAYMVTILPVACQARYASTAGAFFSDVAVTARLHPFDWKVRISFAPTQIAKPLVLKGGNNDGLIDTRALADAGVGAASLFLDDAASWLSVPRPQVLGKTFGDTEKQWESCGPASTVMTIARYWPHIITGLFAETLESLQAPTMLRNARNLAFGLRAPLLKQSPAPHGVSALWMASLQSAEQAAVYKWLDSRAEGPAETAAFGARSPRLWALGGKAADGVLKSAGVETLPGARIGLALSPEEAGLGWYYSEKRRPAVFSNRSALGSVHINIKRLLNVAAEACDVDTRDAVSLATSQISRMGGDWVSNGSLLELDLSLSGGGI